jgi:hypothetical protein
VEVLRLPSPAARLPSEGRPEQTLTLFWPVSFAARLHRANCHLNHEKGQRDRNVAVASWKAVATCMTCSHARVTRNTPLYYFHTMIHGLHLKPVYPACLASSPVPLQAHCQPRSSSCSSAQRQRPPALSAQKAHCLPPPAQEQNQARSQ